MQHTNRNVATIFASTVNGGIGLRGKLPWNLPPDLDHFESVTTKTGSTAGSTNGLIMGRKTWDSLPKSRRPLPNRENVITSSQNTGEVRIFGNLQDAIRYFPSTKQVYIAGGASNYNEAHSTKLANKVYWTRVCGNGLRTDTKVNLSALMDNYEVTSISKSCSFAEKLAYDFVELQPRTGYSPDGESNVPITGDGLPTTSFPIVFPRSPGYFPKLSKIGHEEFQYLTILEDIIQNGVSISDRTGVGVLAKTGALMRFDLRHTFPLLTTKRVYWKGVVEELIWFLRGKTNAKDLSDRGVHIWDANGSREFLDGRGLSHRAEGDLGPVYGFQWRHFGAPYRTAVDDYTGLGVDQIVDVVKTIRKDPSSRRLVVVAWNPEVLNEMALPPCHMMFQFIVDPERKDLTCVMYQRSADWGLGIPFNIASYALLCHLIARATGLRAREFVHVIGHAHVYKSHIEALKVQLNRLPRPFPILRVAEGVKDIDDFEPRHFKLVGYEPWETLKMPMAV